METKPIFSKRTVERCVGGTMKTYDIYTFVGEPAQYDIFRDFRTDADGAMRKEGPTIEIDGVLEPKTFEVRR